VIDKWDYMKLKNCRIRQEMVSKLKRPPTERKKIFPRSTSDKLKKLNCKKINELIKKWATELNRTFSKEEVQMAKKHEKMLTIPGRKGNANQNHTKIPPHPCRIATIKNSTNNKCWRECWEKGTLIYCWWECKLVQPL
jgi:hypothetical protein